MNNYKPPQESAKKYEDTRPKGSYNNAIANGVFTISWHSEHPEFRVMLEATGAQLSDYRRDENSTDELISWAVDRGGRFTRVDFAADAFDSEGSPIDFLDAWNDDRLRTSAKSVSIVERRGRKKSHGATVYIGSRASERLVRVYDKGKQKKTNLDWLRVEIEVKGKRAVQFAGLIVKHGLKAAGLAYLRDVIHQSEIAWFEAIFSDEYLEVDIEKIGRPETSREVWLRTVCLPNIAEAAHQGVPGILEALIAIIQEVEDHQQHGPNLFPK